MPELALALYLCYLGLAFVLRSVLQWRRTGSTGFRGISGPPGSAEWVGGLLFAAALVLRLAAPILYMRTRPRASKPWNPQSSARRESD